MKEVLSINGWVFKERKTCCGAPKERWTNPAKPGYIITILYTRDTWMARQNGFLVKQAKGNELEAYLKSI